MFDWHWLPLHDRWFFYDLECALKLYFVCSVSCIKNIFVWCNKVKMGWLTSFQNTGQYNSKTYYMTIICQVAACIMTQINIQVKFASDIIKVLNDWNGPKWYTIVFTIPMVTSLQPLRLLLSGSLFICTWWFCQPCIQYSCNVIIVMR